MIGILQTRIIDNITVSLAPFRPRTLRLQTSDLQTSHLQTSDLQTICHNGYLTPVSDSETSHSFSAKWALKRRVTSLVSTG